MSYLCTLSEQCTVQIKLPESIIGWLITQHFLGLRQIKSLEPVIGNSIADKKR